MKKLFIVGIAALLLVVFTVPAMAKVKMGGIIFTDFYYLDRNAQSAAANGLGSDPYQVTAIQVPNITRLYGRWTNEDNVGMFIELGIGQTGGAVDNSSSSGVSLRHAYGWWDVTPNFQIMAGKSTTPFSPLNPSQLLGTRSGSLNIIGVGYGNFYSGRFAQVRGTFKFGKVGRVALAIVDPNGSQRFHATYNNYFPYDRWTGPPFNATYQTNTKLPRFDLAVPLYFGPVSLYPGFLFQQRTVDANTSNYDNSVNTYIGSLGVKAGFGGFSISAEGNYGQNWANTRGLIGTSGPSFLASAQLNPVSGEINNSTTYSFWVDLSYKIGPVTPHVMYGQEDSKVDGYFEYNPATWNHPTGQYNMVSTSRMWGFSIPIDLAKGFRVRPELMWYYDGEIQARGTDIEQLGSYAIYGVQFQITF